MKIINESQDMPLNNDDRLIDALLREHARAGTTADEGFLTRLAGTLDQESAAPHMISKSKRVIWSVGIAASVALITALYWNDDVVTKPQSAQTEAPQVANGIALQTELPPELIEGTPKPINVPNLVQAPAKAPEFFVPAGTVLLSKSKPVTSSDSEPIIGSLDLVTDGDKDAGEGYFVELLDGLQWIQIDLEKSASIHAIWLWHFHSQRRAYHDVIIQISNDPLFKTGVTTIYNNDYDHSARMGIGKDRPYVDTRYGMIADGKGTKGRYVRLYSNGNTANEMNHYIEVEVFGIAE